MINKSKKIIVAYCFGATYTKYIPLFVNSVLNNLSDVDILVVSPDKIQNNVRTKIYNKDNERAVIFLENYIPLNYDYSDLSSFISKSQFYRFLRFIIDEEHFRGYSEAYIGDIDIYYPSQINKEIPDLFLREESITKENNLCFNNIIRTDINGSITYRLGGLHYICVDEYYNLYGNIISNIQNNKNAFIKLIEKARNNISANEYLRNEHLLFAMLINNDNINSMKHLLNKNKRELYGLHLGPLRDKNIKMNSIYLFGKEIDNKSQKKILLDFIKFLLKNKNYHFLYRLEMFKLYYYVFQLINK